MSNYFKHLIFRVIVVVVSVQLILAVSETQWGPFWRGFLEAFVFSLGAELFMHINKWFDKKE